MCNLISYAFSFVKARILRTVSVREQVILMPALLPEMETFRLIVPLFMMAQTVILWWNNYRTVQFT